MHPSLKITTRSPSLFFSICTILHIASPFFAHFIRKLFTIINQEKKIMNKTKDILIGMASLALIFSTMIAAKAKGIPRTVLLRLGDLAHFLRLSKNHFAKVIGGGVLLLTSCFAYADLVPIGIDNLSMQIPTDSKALVIYGIPAGTSITGKAEAPKMDDQGNYYQIVDEEAFELGNLALKTEDGFFGDVYLSIHSYSGDNVDTLAPTEIGSLSVYIEPNANDLFFAQSGSIQYNNSSMESGTITLSTTIDSSETQTITFKNTYVNPVVIAYITTANGTESVDVRVKDVTSTSATLFMEEPDNEGHTAEQVTYVVAESGRFTLPDGTRMEARKTTTDSIHRGGESFTGKTVEFSQSFSSTPVVLHTLNTYNNNAFRTSVSTSISSTQFKLQQEAAETKPEVIKIYGNEITIGPRSETIGWIAIESAKSGDINGTNYQTGRSVDSEKNGVDDIPYSLNFSANFNQDPQLLVDGYSGNGEDGYWARSAGNLSYSGASVYAEEDQVEDDERSHSSEGFSFFAIEDDLLLKASKKVPLDIIINPLLDDFNVIISSLPTGVVLLDKDGNSITPADNGKYKFNDVADLQLLSLDISNLRETADIKIRMKGTTNGVFYSTKKVISLNASPLEIAENGDTFLTFPGIREQYKIERIANSFVVTANNLATNSLVEVIENTNEFLNSLPIPGAFDVDVVDVTGITRVEMTKVDRLVFANGVVSASQYYGMHELDSQTADQLDNLADNELIVFSGLPMDAMLNNSIPLGNGAYALPAKDYQGDKNSIEIDYANHTLDAEFSVSVEVVEMTKTEEDWVAGQARISGYANAKVYAERGFDASVSVGPDGVRAEARAYVGAGAVATAGGAVNVEGVLTLSAEVTASRTVSAEIAVYFEVDEDGFMSAVKLEAQTESSVSGKIAVEVEFIPGTSFESGGTATVKAYAYVRSSN